MYHKSKKVLKCIVDLHGAGPTPMATRMVWLPSRPGGENGWVPSCDKCVLLLQRDAARDGLQLITSTVIRGKQVEVEVPDA